MKKQRVYISGPMTGWPREVYMRRFNVADRVLKNYGYQTLNPTRVWACRWPWLYRLVGYRLTLLYDLWLLMTRADRIFVLPGWEKSKGASIEVEVARVLDIPQVNGFIEQEVERCIF